VLLCSYLVLSSFPPRLSPQPTNFDKIHILIAISRSFRSASGLEKENNNYSLSSKLSRKNPIHIDLGNPSGVLESLHGKIQWAAGLNQTSLAQSLLGCEHPIASSDFWNISVTSFWPCMIIFAQDFVSLMELGKESSSQIVGISRNWPRNFAAGVVTVLVPEPAIWKWNLDVIMDYWGKHLSVHRWNHLQIPNFMPYSKLRCSKNIAKHLCSPSKPNNTAGSVVPTTDFVHSDWIRLKIHTWGWNQTAYFGQFWRSWRISIVFESQSGAIRWRSRRWIMMGTWKKT